MTRLVHWIYSQDLIGCERKYPGVRGLRGDPLSSAGGAGRGGLRGAQVTRAIHPRFLRLRGTVSMTLCPRPQGRFAPMLPGAFIRFARRRFKLRFRSAWWISTRRSRIVERFEAQDIMEVVSGHEAANSGRLQLLTPLEPRSLRDISQGAAERARVAKPSQILSYGRERSARRFTRPKSRVDGTNSGASNKKEHMRKGWTLVNRREKCGALMVYRGGGKCLVHAGARSRGLIDCGHARIAEFALVRPHLLRLVLLCDRSVCSTASDFYIAIFIDLQPCIGYSRD